MCAWHLRQYSHTSKVRRATFSHAAGVLVGKWQLELTFEVDNQENTSIAYSYLLQTWRLSAQVGAR